MILTRRITDALLIGGLVLLTGSCRSVTSGLSGTLTAYPALLVLAPHPDDEGDDALKLLAVRSCGSQLGTLARNGSHPPALNGIMDCNGYLTSFVRRTEAFVLVEQKE